MEQWITNLIMEWIITHIPNPDIDHVAASWLPAHYEGIEGRPKLPPVRTVLLLERYLEWPEFYADRTERLFNLLPENSAFLLGVKAEAFILRQRLSAFPQVFVLGPQVPLPAVSFLTLAQTFPAIDNFKAQLSSPFNIYDFDTTPVYDATYHLCVSAVRSLFVAAIVDQLERYKLPQV